MFLHPVGSSFWMPVVSAIAAGIFGWLVGYAAGQIAGADDPAMGGLLIGALLAVFTWILDHFYWLDILRITYSPLPHNEPDDEIDEMIAGKYIVSSEDGREHRILEIPVSDYQMLQFARGVLEGVLPTFPRWTGPDRPFNAVEFQKLRDWLIERGYARSMADRTIEITNDGERLLADITAGRISPAPGFRNGQGK